MGFITEHADSTTLADPQCRTVRDAAAPGEKTLPEMLRAAGWGGW